MALYVTRAGAIDLQSSGGVDHAKLLQDVVLTKFYNVTQQRMFKFHSFALRHMANFPLSQVVRLAAGRSFPQHAEVNISLIKMSRLLPPPCSEYYYI